VLLPEHGTGWICLQIFITGKMKRELALNFHCTSPSEGTSLYSEEVLQN
jgi:hypothetical protein